MRKKKTKTELIMFRVRPEQASDAALVRRLRLATKVSGTPMSQILREGTEKQLKEMAKRFPEIEAVA